MRSFMLVSDPSRLLPNIPQLTPDVASPGSGCTCGQVTFRQSVFGTVEGAGHFDEKHQWLLKRLRRSFMGALP